MRKQRSETLAEQYLEHSARRKGITARKENLRRRDMMQDRAPYETLIYLQHCTEKKPLPRVQLTKTGET
jgi:hypothetical protein